MSRHVVDIYGERSTLKPDQQRSGLLLVMFIYSGDSSFKLFWASPFVKAWKNNSHLSPHQNSACVPLVKQIHHSNVKTSHSSYLSNSSIIFNHYFTKTIGLSIVWYINNLIGKITLRSLYFTKSCVKYCRRILFENLF